MTIRTVTTVAYTCDSSSTCAVRERDQAIPLPTGWTERLKSPAGFTLTFCPDCTTSLDDWLDHS